MTAAELLTLLQQSNCQVALDGDNIRVRGSLPDDLRQAIRQHKPSLLTLLRERENARRDTRAAEITRELREQGFATVRPAMFNGEVVLWIRDEKVAIPTRWKEAVTYTLAELKSLTDNPPGEDELRLLHRAKQVFNERPVS